MVIETVLWSGVIVSATGNVALPAFRPDSYRTTRRARRAIGIMTVVWVIFLPVAGAVSLGLGADALASGQRDAWQGTVTSGVALACWPVAILAVRKRRAIYRNP